MTRSQSAMPALQLSVDGVDHRDREGVGVRVEGEHAPSGGVVRAQRSCLR